MGDEEDLLEAYLLADRGSFAAVLDALLDRARGSDDEDAPVALQRRLNARLFCDPRPPPGAALAAWAAAEIVREVERRRVELLEPLLDSLLSARAAATAASAGRDLSSPPPFEHSYISVRREGGARTFVAVRARNSFEHVGMRVWAAGLHLANLLASDPSLVRGLRVLELGAGIGATVAALAAAMRREDAPGEWVLTDYEPSVVDNMRHNVGACGWPVRCETLDWCALPPGALCGGFDLVVAADVTYDPALAPPLAAAFAAFLSAGAAGILCSTLRNPSTFAAFQEAFETAGIRLNEIPFHGPFPVRPAAESAPVLLHQLSMRDNG